MMNLKPRALTTLVALLTLVCSVIYFISSYAESSDSDGDIVGSQVQTIFFVSFGIIYAPVGIWMIKDKLYSRAPYVITMIVSGFLIVLYVASRNLNLPLVGMQTDVGMVDIITKGIQGVVFLSALLMGSLKQFQVMPTRQKYTDQIGYE